MSEKMREISFRGKRIDNGEWVFGDLLRAKSYIDDIERYYIFTDAKAFPANEFIGDEEIIRKTVGQFTGLTDKKGRKIFEGDILFVWSDYHEKNLFEGIVQYGEFNCTCCDGVYGWYLNGGDIRRIDEYEVLGNIHDNPELIPGFVKEAPNV